MNSFKVTTILLQMAKKHTKRCPTSLIIQRNENQNHNEVPSHASQNGCYQKKSTNNKSWRACREKEPSYTVGGNANQYSHYGEQCGDSLKNWKQNCHRTQQSHCWAYTLRKPELKETRVPQCSLQHCLQQPGHGSNLDVHQQMNG